MTAADGATPRENLGNPGIVVLLTGDFTSIAVEALFHYSSHIAVGSSNFLLQAASLEPVPASSSQSFGFHPRIIRGPHGILS